MNALHHLSAAEIIARLESEAASRRRALSRDVSRCRASTPTAAPHSTAIYFLLARGERSHWHRIDAVEIWHYYAGAPLTLRIADGDGQRTLQLGADLAAGEVPQGDRAAARLAGRGEHRRLDAGRLHRGAGIRFCDVRTGAEGLVAALRSRTVMRHLAHAPGIRNARPLRSDAGSRCRAHG